VHDVVLGPGARLRIGASTLETRIDRRQVLRSVWKGGDSFGTVLGASSAMHQLFAKLEKVAQTDASVLILGESGTGKELVARMIHDHSPRAGGPFKAVNCAALTETLLESELFGHEKGAFTGADKRRTGLFEAAAGGTLFLDEIGEVSPSVQSKLLRALEEREVIPIGSTDPIRVDARVLAATNVDLESAIVDGAFRQDLYYRLNVFPIVLPALRERRDDVPLLVAHFLEELFPGEPVDPGAGVLEALVAYDWPGNVRELRNVIERATILAGGPAFGPEHVALPGRTGEAALAAAAYPSRADEDLHLPADGVNLEQLEARFIREALARARGNKSQAARLLGITRRALYCRMEKYGLRAEGETPAEPSGLAS
jgi:DNA-binding NtrC family response regulator